jgi:DNA-binding transcriptional ArsR family regulator
MKAFATETLDELLRALAHADRRLFLRLCRDQVVSAGELASASTLALASVSEHLKVLRKTGLLVQERRGRFLYYRTDIALLQRLVLAVASLEDK